MTIDLDYLDYLRDHLLDKENTLYLADCAIERKYEKQPSDEVSQTLRSLAQINLRSNIDIIYENAGSPIEKIFLNAVNLSGFMISQFFLDWTPPFYSASRQVECFRQKAEQIEYLYAEYVNATGRENQKEFVDSAEQSGDFSNEEMKFIKTHMMFYKTGVLDKAYHLTMQAGFPEIKVDSRSIRTDLYIWLPSNPGFNRIVECDGFQFHADESAFSRDRKRDRVLKSKGFDVLRFAGKETYNNPVSCAHELLKYLLQTDSRESETEDV